MIGDLKSRIASGARSKFTTHRRRSGGHGTPAGPPAAPPAPETYRADATAASSSGAVGDVSAMAYFRPPRSTTATTVATVSSTATGPAPLVTLVTAPTPDEKDTRPAPRPDVREQPLTEGSEADAGSSDELDSHHHNLHHHHHHQHSPRSAISSPNASPDLATPVPRRSRHQQRRQDSDAPASAVRRQSLVTSANSKFAHSLLAPDALRAASGADDINMSYITPSMSGMQLSANMLSRKVWVKRPGGSATLLLVREDDLLDDARDVVLRKYGNSMGKTYDAPDVSLRIYPRDTAAGEKTADRLLSPDEDLCRTLDAYYPGGQGIEEALVIEVPARRTPRPSPRMTQMLPYLDEHGPAENATDYFPPVTYGTTLASSPGGYGAALAVSATQAASSRDSQGSSSQLNHPLLPSPGGGRKARYATRPRHGRQQTSSPPPLSHAASSTSIPSTAATATNAANSAASAGVTAATSGVSSAGVAGGPVLHTRQAHQHQGSRSRIDSSPIEMAMPFGNPATPALPTPPLPPAPVLTATGIPAPLATQKGVDASQLLPTMTTSATAAVSEGRPNLPPLQVSAGPVLSPRLPPPNRSHKSRNQAGQDAPKLPAGLLDGVVPPINVLLVEDNIINLKLLEAFMKRLKVRWQAAMNGRDAVTAWRSGGFHLVLMDIQLPVMNGLEATKEIRRLERVNGVGVFGHADAGRAKSAAGHETPDQLADEDRLLKGPLFKSAVIIVALTASSLQSDRHEALAAGCNDFLTKPVNFVWLERKVKEWGCMQALIDFDGWRKWKDYGNAAGAGPGKMKGGAGAATAAPESSGHGSQKDARPSAASATNSSFEGGKTLSTTSLKNDTSDSKEDSS